MPSFKEGLVRHAATRPAPSYLERGSTNHLDRSTEKSSACAIAADLLEQNILGNERYVAQTKDDVGRRENNMTQITSIKLGVIVMCVATVPLSLAQMPRIGTSGSKPPGAPTTAPTGHSGLSGTSPVAPQTGTNFRSGTITAPNTNVGAHIGTNAGAQTGFSNQAVGITGAAAGLSGSSGNSTGATQTGANARTGTNTTANTNAGAHTGTAAATPTTASTIDSAPIHPFAHSPRSKFLDGGGVPLAATIGHGHPNSDSDPGAIALIRHWRLIQRRKDVRTQRRFGGRPRCRAYAALLRGRDQYL